MQYKTDETTYTMTNKCIYSKGTIIDQITYKHGIQENEIVLFLGVKGCILQSPRRRG